MCMFLSRVYSSNLVCIDFNKNCEAGRPSGLSSDCFPINQSVRERKLQKKQFTVLDSNLLQEFGL